MTVYIYCLSDPRDKRVRYIGKTKNIANRFEYHLYNFTGSNPRKENWIKGLRKKEMRPEISIIEECEDSVWKERERYWISYYREIYDDLTNIKNGGECSYESVDCRSKRILEFAKRFKLKTYKCYACKGITISRRCLCKHCLFELSNNGKDEWAQLFKRDDRSSNVFKEIPFSMLGREDHIKLMNIPG